MKRKGTLLALAALTAFLILEIVRHNVLVNSEELAFGTETVNQLGEVNGSVAHCNAAAEAQSCVDAYLEEGGGPTILWLGNSQLPGINRYEKGDENAPQILHKLIRQRGYYLATFSQPNANLMEHTFVYSAMVHQFDTKLLVLPVVFDDLREHGIRSNLVGYIDMPNARESLESATFGPDLLELIEVGNPETNNRASPGSYAVSRSIQDRVESSFEGWLEKNWDLWAARQEMRGTLAIAIHLLRNQALGIHSYTKRRVPDAVYTERMILLDRLLAQVSAAGIDTLLYVPPYRRDIEGPYIESQYAKFKTDLAVLAERNDAYFADFENVVPGPFWGTVTDRLFGFKEPDFMHFTADGHQMFATAIDRKLEKLGY